MEKRARTRADTVQFIREAVLEGAHKRTPEGLKPSDWVNMRNIGGTYFLHPNATLKEIGQKNKAKLGEARQTIDNFLRGLHQVASDELRTKYPLAELSKEKQLSIESRRNISQNLGGAATLVEEKFEDGMSYEDLRKVTGVTARRYARARETLRRWGKEIPRGRRIRAEEIERLLNQIANAQSFEEKQRLLVEGVDVNLHNYGTTRDDRVLIPVYPLLKSTGIHVGPQKIQPFVDILRTAGIPVGEVPGRAQYKKGPSRNLFIVRSDIEEARKILAQYQANGSFLQAQLR